MSEPEKFKVWTLEDMSKVHAGLPEDRKALFIKEMGDCIGMMSATYSMFRDVGAPEAVSWGPVTWINDTKGKATMNVSTSDGSFEGSATFNIPEEKDA